MLKNRICKLSFIFSFSFLLWSCSYHPVIQQGNILDQASLEQIKLGMNKEQIAYLIGSPVLQDISNADLWDYVYQERQNTSILERKTLRLEFENDKLIKITIPKNEPNLIKKQNN